MFFTSGPSADLVCVDPDEWAECEVINFDINDHNKVEEFCFVT